jgi:hypothetical protein
MKFQRQDSLPTHIHNIGRLLSDDKEMKT